MAVLRLFPRDALVQPVPAAVPTAGLVVSTVLSMITIAVLAVCFTRRVQEMGPWFKIPLARWLILGIYLDSILFIFITSVLEHGYGLNRNMATCSTAILICLICYMSTKVLIYYFLVEKVYIIRCVSECRLKSKLYVFNCFGMLLPYCVVVILNFVYRTAYFDKSGMCIIGMKEKAMMPLIIFDAVVNFYLTLLFVIPLRALSSYTNSSNSVLRTIALRSFIGSLGTLTSSVVNLTVLMVLRGEAAWICLMCCNADILFSVVVLHWVTSKDSSTTSSTWIRNPSIIVKKIQAGRTPPSPTTIINKLETFGVYGDGKKLESGGTATTYISAQELRRVSNGEEEDDDMYRIYSEWSRRNSSGVNSFPTERTKVQAGPALDDENGLRSGTSFLDAGEDITEMGLEADRGRGPDYLVEKV